MKKAVVWASLLVMSCTLFAGCTQTASPDHNTAKTQSVANIPTQMQMRTMTLVPSLSLQGRIRAVTNRDAHVFLSGTNAYVVLGSMNIHQVPDTIPTQEKQRIQNAIKQAEPLITDVYFITR